MWVIGEWALSLVRPGVRSCPATSLVTSPFLRPFCMCVAISAGTNELCVLLEVLFDHSAQVVCEFRKKLCEHVFTSVTGSSGGGRLSRSSDCIKEDSLDFFL